MTLRGDHLIVGSGIAALRAAAELAGAGPVIILTKAASAEGNTGYAQGGIAAAVGPDDSLELHVADTLAAGDGLSDPDAVRVLVEDGRRLVLELVAWGARFDRDADGEPALAREGAHSVRRVLHARDATGREINRVLWQRVASRPDVRVIEHARAVEALVEDGRCVGMRYLDERGALVPVLARTTLLATGGAARIYRESTNPEVATGDGVAIAWRAGARVADLEFVQFHPTVLDAPGAPRFLLSEALRGEGAHVVNAAGERFMARADPDGELAPRDRVARAIAREADRTGRPVYLSLRHLAPDFVHERFPAISAVCRQAGLDLARDPVPVGPAAHYVMGGVETDLDARTSIPGLFAAGEVACTRVHGANRLASNSLLEGLVFGARAARAMRAWAAAPASRPPEAAAPRPARRVAPGPPIRDDENRGSHVAPGRPVPRRRGPRSGRARARRGVGGHLARRRRGGGVRRGRLARAEPARRRAARGPGGTSPAGEPRGALPLGLSRPRRYTLEDSCDRRHHRGTALMADKKDAFVTEITPRSEDFSRWYTDVIRRAELADYSPVKGCMVIRPYGYAIWELIQQGLDRRLKDTGHVNAYFPLFVPESLLRKEADHVEGFAPQVAWVTQGGEEELDERLAIRPTSEAIIGTMYAKWIQSWRDLPVLINQWANIVRWEKVTRLFLRTTEFLWQEGHTAHETAEEAEAETRKILALYKEFVETELAMPVIDGRKSESEKFAGASMTYSIEALMGDGRALQAGTSHNLGQNFAKAFGIQFQGRDKSLQHAWTTSWGMTTRLIGGVVMTHGDDSGLVLPPRVAPYQVVIVPIQRGSWQETVLPSAKAIHDALSAAGVRVHLDDRDAYTTGWKFAEWELRGVPLRVEIGPKDIEKSQVVLVRRDTREKLFAPVDGLAGRVDALLGEIQQALYDRALKFRQDNTAHVASYDEFKRLMEGRPGFLIAPWCGSDECEALIKAETQATVRNIPFGCEGKGGTCIKCGQPATAEAYFAKAYSIRPRPARWSRIGDTRPPLRAPGIPRRTTAPGSRGRPSPRCRTGNAPGRWSAPSSAPRGTGPSRARPGPRAAPEGAVPTPRAGGDLCQPRSRLPPYARPSGALLGVDAAAEVVAPSVSRAYASPLA